MLSQMMNDGSDENGALDMDLQRFELTRIFFNVLTASLDMRKRCVLTTEEALLTWLVSSSKKDYFCDLCELVDGVPSGIYSSQDFMIDNVLEIVYETHNHGPDNFGKMMAVLSFVSCYIEMILNSGEMFRWKFALKLAKFYTEERGDWLKSIGGVCKGLKRTFPHSWRYFYIKQKWLQFISMNR
ncbi:Bcl-2 [Rhinolophus gammaherpesvirus 1]|uniref:Bcl-2 n=1 Tax=Rhinolophus gammaherpesvirus 1 TaxID=2054179 RepID=A0A2Z5U692_9GAMA|nr:Bcl-2 [Rhinolophus gammaherpesvirus 1]BBB06454.1 Bcl-2 [Rhinolophus gammaherpesvirus 1]